MSALPTDRPNGSDAAEAASDAEPAAPALDATADLAAAVGPLLTRIGASIVSSTDVAADDDIPVPWRGEVAFHVRLDTPGEAPGQMPGDLTDALANLIADVERELDSPLAVLPRAGKQRAVRLLEERGAFELRRSAETVADALGVTRFTVYNYLNRSRADG